MERPPPMYVLDHGLSESSRRQAEAVPDPNANPDSSPSPSPNSDPDPNPNPNPNPTAWRRQVEGAYAHTRWVSSALPRQGAGAAAGASTRGAHGSALGDSGEVLDSSDMYGRLTKFALNKEKVRVRVRARAMVRVRARVRMEGHAGHPLSSEDVLGRELRHHRGHGELGVAGQGSGEG